MSPEPLKALSKASESPYVFTSERGGPMSAAGFRKQLARWGVKAKLRFPVNPHMLRHACGYALANRGMDTRSLQAYLGHASETIESSLNRIIDGRILPLDTAAQ